MVYDKDGEIVRGRLPVVSVDAATEVLESQGYRVIELRQVRNFLNWSSLRTKLISIRPREVVLLYRQLALLLESGLDLVTSLELLHSQITNPTLGMVLGEVITEVRKGTQLSSAMDRHPKVFSNLGRRTLEVGEQTGNLEVMLHQTADYEEREMAAGKGVKNALTYPVITLLVAVVVIGVLITTVMPSFGNLYDQVGAELPALTQAMITFGVLLQQYWYLPLGVAVVLELGTVLYSRTASGRYRWHRIQLKIPMTGRVMQLKELARASRSLSLLYRAGLPMTEILPLLIQSSGNLVVARGLNEVNDAMLRGEGLSRPMSRNKIFLPLMVQMVRVGEESGTLDKTLMAVAENYGTEVEDSTRSIIAMIQPAMTIFLGLVIGLIALSMVDAMYSVYGQGI